MGSLNVAILAKLGYSVVAISGKVESTFLNQMLGAADVIEREVFVGLHQGKALSKPVFSAGVDTIGGPVLLALLKATGYGGLVTCCGIISSSELQTSIFRLFCGVLPWRGLTQ